MDELRKMLDKNTKNNEYTQFKRFMSVDRSGKSVIRILNPVLHLVLCVVLHLAATPNEGLFFTDENRFNLLPSRLSNNIAKMTTARAGHRNSLPGEAEI